MAILVLSTLGDYVNCLGVYLDKHSNIRDIT